MGNLQFETFYVGLLLLLTHSLFFHLKKIEPSLTSFSAVSRAEEKHVFYPGERIEKFCIVALI